MTQGSSIKAKEKFFTKVMLGNGIMGFKQNFKLAVVLFVLHMTAAPLTISMCIASIFSTGRAEVNGYAGIAVLTTGAAAMAGILCALSAMPYLYKKSVVDMWLSRSMTTLQRFVSDFLSGLCVYVLPFVASSIISLLLTLAGHIACDGKTFYLKGGHDFSGWECHLFEEAAPLLIKGIIGGILLMIMFYTLTLLVSCCCGSVFECVCYTLLANGLIPGSIAMAVMALLEDVYGLVPESYLSMIIPYTSPVGGCIGLVFSLQSSYENAVSGYDNPAAVTYGKWLVIFTLVTLVYIFCTYLIYRRRNAEDTGNPIVYSALFHVIMTLGTACIVYAFMYNSEDVVPMIIITAIIYFVFSVIRRRGFKKFWRSAVSYICTMFVCMGSFALITATEGFGAAKYVPSPGAVSACYLNYGGAYESSLDVNFTGFDLNYNDVPLKITQREALEIISDVHRMSAEWDYSEYSGQSICIMYRLRSGRLVVRQLRMSDEAVLKLAQIDQMNETKEYRANKAKQAALGLKSYYGNGSTDKNYITLSPQWRLYDGGSRIHEASTMITAYLPADFYEKLGDCLYRDIMNETEADYFTDPHGIMQLCYGNDTDYYYRSKEVVIRSYYASTLEYLRGCGFKTEFEISKTFGLSAASHATVAMVSDRIMENMKGREMTTFTACPSAYGSIRVGTEDYHLPDYASVREKYGLTEDLYTVMANSYKRYKTDESCYTIIVNGNAAVIDPRYNEAAERLFIVLTVQEWMYRLEEYNWYNRNETERYKAFLKSFLTCYGREKIDSIAKPGVSIYDMMFSYANSDYDNPGVYLRGRILADKYTGYSYSYYSDYSDSSYGFWEDYPVDEEFNDPNSFGF